MSEVGRRGVGNLYILILLLRGCNLFATKVIHVRLDGFEFSVTFNESGCVTVRRPLQRGLAHSGPQNCQHESASRRGFW